MKISCCKQQNRTIEGEKKVAFCSAQKWELMKYKLSKIRHIKLKKKNPISWVLCRGLKVMRNDISFCGSYFNEDCDSSVKKGNWVNAKNAMLFSVLLISFSFYNIRSANTISTLNSIFLQYAWVFGHGHQIQIQHAACIPHGCYGNYA